MRFYTKHASLYRICNPFEFVCNIGSWPKIFYWQKELINYIEKKMLIKTPKSRKYIPVSVIVSSIDVLLAIFLFRVSGD